MKRRIVVGISGASGVIVGVRLLEALRALQDVETHLILTKPAERTIAEETDYKIPEVKALASFVHDPTDIGASVASGSFKTHGMAIVPCSIHTAASIAYCNAENLLTRAADVVLKERRPLVLAVRETPLHVGHLKALLAAAEAGAIILPPLPGFYLRPATVDDLVLHLVSRVLDQLGIENDLTRRWGEGAR